ncbi:bifunctional DNA-binding transcriptional regulator/O6-methylguanine-DNA methyltransferase Ada [Acanthopleuribacter pedis]
MDETGFWQAVVDRDATFDNRFVFAVKTTAVYCRPSCPSRRAKRENVVFFENAPAAEAAGFRACLRCASKHGQTGEKDKTLIAVADYLSEHAADTLTLQALAARFGLSPYHLQRRFKAAFGVSPKAFQTAKRFEQLKQALRAGDHVTGAIFEAGFGSTSRVYETVDRQLGMTPSTYRAGGASLQIHYAIRDTHFGLLLMAATERGVCLVHFGETEAALTETLSREFPQAALQVSAARESRQLDQWITALEHHLRGNKPLPHIPLHLSGTAFQLSVWRFLTTLERGQTATYKEVAGAIGKTKAHRAVANACGANRIALLIPCHRVLRGDGGVGGYRWGTDRKQQLLACEQSHPTPEANGGNKPTSARIPNHN